MKTTYFIEHIASKQLVEYHRTLADAKSLLCHLPEKEYRIVMMKGPRFGEGWHKYQVIYFGNVFLKQAI
jgi:hypothetical protein